MWTCVPSKSGSSSRIKLVCCLTGFKIFYVLHFVLFSPEILEFCGCVNINFVFLQI